MKTEQGVQMLIPSIKFGNITLISRVTLDSEADGDIVSELAEDEDNLAIATTQVARELALMELAKMKRAINKLTSEDFKLEVE